MSKIFVIISDKTEDGDAKVISQRPDGEWIFSEDISIADVMNSPPWIEDE